LNAFLRERQLGTSKFPIRRSKNARGGPDQRRVAEEETDTKFSLGKNRSLSENGPMREEKKGPRSLRRWQSRISKIKQHKQGMKKKGPRAEKKKKRERVERVVFWL